MSSKKIILSGVTSLCDRQSIISLAKTDIVIDSIVDNDHHNHPIQMGLVKPTGLHFL